MSEHSAKLEHAFEDPLPVDARRVLVERIARLEEQKNAVAAEQAAAILEFARAEVAAQTVSGVVEPEALEPEALERSVAAQVGLACRVSPSEGRKRVRIARDLHAGLGQVRALFAAGLLSEYKVATIVAAASHLDPGERAAVDHELAAQHVETLGVRRIHTLTTMITARVAREKFAQRCRTARTGRRVSVRPSTEPGMADLIAHLPVEDAVTSYAALAKAVTEAAVNPEPLTRGRGQVMADTLVERLTGHTRATDTDVQVHVIVPVEALLDPSHPAPAEIPGHGPVPLDRILTGAGRRNYRRLLSRDGIVIGGDSRQRTFTGALAELIRARDQHQCRAPYCDAPIRHLDHIVRWADGGATEFDNGQGYCELHNQLREQSLAGWSTAFPADPTPSEPRHRPGTRTRVGPDGSGPSRVDPLRCRTECPSREHCCRDRGDCQQVDVERAPIG